MKKIMMVVLLLPFLLIPTNISAVQSNDFSVLSEAQKEWIKNNYSSFSEYQLILYANNINKYQNGYLFSAPYYNGAGELRTWTRIAPDGTVQTNFSMIMTRTLIDKNIIFYSYMDGYKYNAFSCSDDIEFDFNTFTCPVPEPPDEPDTPTDNNQILQYITYTNPRIEYEYVNDEPTLIYMYYDVTVSYYGEGLDVYYGTGTNNKIQSNVNKFIYTYTDYSWQTCCNIPTIPNSQYNIGTSFTKDNYTVVPTTASSIIEVINPSMNDYINDGNDNSKESNSNLIDSNSSLSDSISQYDNLEQTYKNELDSNLGNLNLDFNFGNITDFINTASFVRTQFDNITNDNPIGLLIGFSLAVGISLLIIGKRL